MCKSGRRKRDIDETRSSDSGGSKNIPLARQGLRQWKDEDKTLARTPGAKVISDPCGAGYIRQQEHLRVHADWRNWQFPSPVASVQQKSAWRCCTRDFKEAFEGSHFRVR